MEVSRKLGSVLHCNNASEIVQNGEKWKSLVAKHAHNLGPAELKQRISGGTIFWNKIDKIRIPFREKSKQIAMEVNNWEIYVGSSFV